MEKIELKVFLVFLIHRFENTLQIQNKKVNFGIKKHIKDN